MCSRTEKKSNLRKYNWLMFRLSNALKSSKWEEVLQEATNCYKGAISSGGSLYFRLFAFGTWRMSEDQLENKSSYLYSESMEAFV